MDGVKWSKVLYHWVKETNVIDVPGETLENCDVYNFYEKFREKIVTKTTVTETSVIKFLEVNFPNFDIHLNDDNKISSTDYMYVYSLLLYFCCVKYSEKYFQEICSNLKEGYQLSIATFFKSIVNKDTINRAIIRNAIHDAVPLRHLAPPPIALESPARRPITKSSPPTPKTLILDEKSRELMHLKAQLESEKYEKSFLESQLKDKDERISRLTEERKHMQNELRELKDEVTSCNNENFSPNRIKRSELKLIRYEKQMNEKEALIERLKVDLENCNEQSKNASEKIGSLNLQIVEKHDRIKDLEIIIQDLTENNEQKGEHIKCLQESNAELQTYIKENRINVNGNLLNTSSDILDTSFTTSVASSTTSGRNLTGSPENLAHAVVDVQLKEKEYENMILRNSLEMFEMEKNKVSNVINVFLKKYTEFVGELSTKHDAISFTEKVAIFTDTYEQLYKKYDQLFSTNKDLSTINISLKSDIDSLEKELETLKKDHENLMFVNTNLEKQLIVIKNVADEYKTKLFEMENDTVSKKRDYLILLSEKDTVKQKYDKLLKEYDCLCGNSTNLKIDFNNLKEEYESMNEKIDYLLITFNDDNEGSFASYFEKLDDLKDKLVTMKHDKNLLYECKSKLEKDLQLTVKEKNDAEKKVNELIQNVATLKEENDGLCSTNNLNECKLTKIQEEYSTMCGQKSDIEKQLFGANNNLSEIRLQNQNMLAEKSIIDHNMMELKNDNDGLKKIISDLQCDLHDNVKAYDELQIKYKSCENEKDLLQLQISENVESFDSLLQEKQNLESQIVQYKQDMLCVNENLQKALTEKENLVCKLNNMTKMYEDEISSLKTEIASLNDRRTDLENQYLQLYESFDILKNENSILLKEKDLCCLQIQSIIKSVSILEQKISSLNEEYCSKLTNVREKFDMTLQHCVQIVKGKILATAETNNKIEYLTQENNDLNEKNLSLDLVLSKVSEENRNMEDERKNLRITIDSISSDNRIKSELIKELTESLEKLQKIKTSIEDKLSLQQQDYSVVSKEKDVFEIKISQLEIKNKDLVEKMSLLTSELKNSSSLEEIISSLKKSNKTLEEEKQAKINDIDQLNLTLKEEIQHLNIVSSEKLALETQVIKLLDEVSLLACEKAEMSDKIDSILMQKIKLENTLENVNIEKLNIERNLEEIVTQNQNLEEKMKDFEITLTKNIKLEGEIVDLVNQLHVLEQHNIETINIKDEIDVKLKILINQNNVLEEEKTKLEGKLNQIIEEREELEGNMLEIGAEKLKLEQILKQKDDKIGKMQHTIDANNLHLKLLESKINDLTKAKINLETVIEDTDILKTTLNDERDKCAELLKSNEQLKADMSSSLAQQTKLNEEINKLQQKVNDIMTEKERLSNNLELFQLNNKELSESVINYEKVLNEKNTLENNLSNLLDDLSVLKKQHTDLEVKFENISSLKNTVEKDLQKSEQLKNDLENKLKKMTDLQQTQALLINEKDDLMLQLQEATEKYISSDLKIKELTKTVEISNTEQLINAKKLTDYENEKLALETQNIKLSDEVSLLSGEKAEMSAKMDIILMQKIKLESTLENVRIEKLNIEKNLEVSDNVSKKENECLSKKINDLQQTQVLLIKEKDDLTLQLQEATEKYISSEIKIKELKKIVETANTELLINAKKLTDYENEKLALETQNIKLIDEVSLLSGEKAEMSVKFDTILMQKNKLESTVENVRIEKLNIEKNLEVSDNVSKKENECLSKKINDLQQTQALLMKEKDDLKLQLKEATEKYISSEIKFKELTKIVETANTELLINAKKLTDNKNEITELLREKTELSMIIEQKDIKEKSLEMNCKFLKDSLETKNNENAALLTDTTTLKDKLHSLTVENTKYECAQKLYESKILQLEMENTTNLARINTLQELLNKTEKTNIEENSKVSDLLELLKKYEDTETKLHEMEKIQLKERMLNEKLAKDNEIYNAKLYKVRDQIEEKEKAWTEERMKLIEKLTSQSKSADERIKEVRMEYEGKLEKMKDKMKCLYNDEMAKINRKHEKELTDMKNDIKNEAKKYERIHVANEKLSSQIMALNEKNLELTKENEIMKTKLKISEEVKYGRKSALPPAHTRQFMESNLKMEDEEGEVFNTTYLTDLKAGRMSPTLFGRESSIPMSEINARNSLCPPHLRSSYAVQYDPDEEFRDGCTVNLDDSSASLISRRKTSGTSYKRPGPPTPSKNAGRLSLGNTTFNMLNENVPYQKDPLKDQNAHGGSMNLTKAKQTPGKFKSMFSTTSLLKSLQKDENTPPKRRLSIFKNKR